MKPSDLIRQFDLSPQARAGLFVKNLRGQVEQGEHDVATPHRDGHYLLVLATRGELTLNIDFKEVIVTSPAVLLIAPGQVHHILAAKDVQGWAVGFEPSLIDGEFQQVLAKLLRGSVVMRSEPTLLARSTGLLQLLEEVQSDAANAYTGRVLRSLLIALLNMLAGQLIGATTQTKKKERRAVVIEEAFHQLLEQHYQTWKQPAHYADALAVTVAHLNEVVKTISGISPSTLIQERAILEAKRLLYYTQLSVEIGYALGYKDPIYFNKLFRKLTGQTPLNFRRQFRD